MKEILELHAETGLPLYELDADDIEAVSGGRIRPLTWIERTVRDWWHILTGRG